MEISVIIPCYNEENTIRKLVESVINSPATIKELIIVDDYSSDSTSTILKELEGPLIKVIYHRENLGKGAALRSGFKAATGDICIIQDADLEYDPSELPILVQPIIAKKLMLFMAAGSKEEDRTE